MNKNITKRNSTLDFLKLIAAYMVVFIHVPFYGTFGMIVKALARFAVPVFFMTSGFFCFGNDDKKIRFKMLKIVRILVFTSILYNCMNIVTAYNNDGINGVIQQLSVYFNINRWISFLFFNLPFSATRLWFLLALIYVYIMQLLFLKHKIHYKSIFIISSVGLLLNLILGELLSIFSINLPDYYTRNFLLTGYPFFGFGLLLRQFLERIIIVKPSTIILGLTSGIILTLISFPYAENVMLYLGTVLIVFSIFFIALKKSDKTYSAWQLQTFSCSLGIYIFHRPITLVCGAILKTFSISPGTVLYANSLPILVCVITTIFTLILKLSAIKIINFNNKIISGKKDIH